VVVSSVVALALCLTSAAAAQVPGPDTGGGQGQPPAPLPNSVLPITLLGVMADSADPSRSACLVRCTYPKELRFASTLQVGANACDIAEIVEIRPDAIVVKNLLTNRLELLELQKTSAPTAVPATAEPPAPPVVRASKDVVDVALPKASVDHYLLNLPELLSSAQATPHYRDELGPRTIEGFEIGQIKPGSVVDQLGLKNGDVILEVNGEKLDSLATVLRLFGQAQATTQARLTVLRGGQRLTFVFNTK
jgi:type II secretory pathway component PulC